MALDSKRGVLGLAKIEQDDPPTTFWGKPPLKQWSPSRKRVEFFASRINPSSSLVRPSRVQCKGTHVTSRDWEAGGKVFSLLGHIAPSCFALLLNI